MSAKNLCPCRYTKKNHSQFLSTSATATKQSHSNWDKNIVNFHSRIPCLNLQEHMSWEIHTQPPSQLSPSSAPAPPSPGQTHCALGSTERAEGWAPIHRAWVRFGRPFTCLLMGLRGKRKSLPNSKEQRGSQCVMQMINSNLWRFGSIPGLTEKDQENSNLKKEKEESVELFTALSRGGPGEATQPGSHILLLIRGKIGLRDEIKPCPRTWLHFGVSPSVSVFAEPHFMSKGRGCDMRRAVFTWLSPLFAESMRKPFETVTPARPEIAETFTYFCV